MIRSIQTKTGSRLRIPVAATDRPMAEVLATLEKWGIPAMILGGPDDSVRKKTLFCVTGQIEGVEWIDGPLDDWLQEKAERLPPSMLTQAANFVTAMADHAIHGLPSTPPEELEQRRELCEKCDRLIDGRCTECGCFTNIKSTWAGQACPLGKW